MLKQFRMWVLLSRYKWTRKKWPAQIVFQFKNNEVSLKSEGDGKNKTPFFI